MSLWTGNAIIAKAKSIYGYSLKEKDYLELVKKRTIPEFVSYLKKHPRYIDILADVQENAIHRGQLEELIKKNSFNYILKLVKFVRTKDESFYHLNIVQMEIEFILTALRSMISGTYDYVVAEIPIYLQKHSSFDILKLIEAKTYSDLLSTLEKTDYYKILLPFRVDNINDIKYVNIQHALEEFYYQSIFASISKNYSGKLAKDLINIFATRIELNNIVKIYRLKKFYKADPDVIRNSLISNKYSRFDANKIDFLISLQNPNDILHYLEKSEFSRFTDENEYIYVEYYAERIQYNLAKRFMYYSHKVQKVYSAFLILTDIEVDNLINIIEGIRYQLPEDEIRRILIY